MNEGHLKFLASPEWLHMLETDLLPWLEGVADLGDDVLEVGPGPGLTTDLLRQRTAKLTAVGAPTARVSETKVTQADAPKVLAYNWGGQDIRWELEAFGGGTRLTLWHNIDRAFISMGAAGWHICFDVLDHLLSGTPIGRIVGPGAMKFGWQRLNAEYAKQFGIETFKAGPE